jgi:hypothetical protein
MEEMKGDLQKFQQSMALGKHKDAQEILDGYKLKIGKWF